MKDVLKVRLPVKEKWYYQERTCLQQTTDLAHDSHHDPVLLVDEARDEIQQATGDIVAEGKWE